MIMWLVHGHSESGDHYQDAFLRKPTPKQLSALAHKWDGDPNKDGPGYDGSYVHLTITEVVK